ncbi:MAG: bifunctional 3-(3-hydroxy-phenyl)propionate/3-hydroxycinnamic acid hydroxylase [Pseudolabrys sp.]|nr:bifunctional 3-(3-hydroxy-phenyl)propionate/3-hydroxycinnamic acid hydroxylase [Pseudolabrys sp.]
MSATHAFDIAIIGCGPVGALAANLFGHAGLKTAVIERQVEPYPLPRAVHIDHEMMRIFQSIGLADDMLPLMREGEGHIHIGADGGVIRYLGSKGLPKRFGWANDYFFYQPELEAKLRDAMRRLPQVQLWTGASVTALSDTGERVSLTLDDGRAINARYVVACDGANSFVRKSLGIRLADLKFEEPWLVVDAEVDGPIRLPDFAGVPTGANLQHLSIMLCDPKRPATLVPGRGRHRRWEFMLLPGEGDEEMMRSDRVDALTAPYVAGVNYQLVRAATYRFHGLLAERWQKGRVFLAGDAAHQTPPFFGQGMCHGFRDVMNLSWKFAAVLKQDAAPSLLDTYQIEREPHVRAVIEAAVGAGRYICERDPDRARARDDNLRAAMGKPAPRSASDLIPAIQSGVVADKSAGTGSRFIQPFVESDGQRMLLDDATSGGFVLLTTDSDVLKSWNRAQIEFWHGVGGKSFVVGSPELVDADGAIAGWLRDHEATAVLLRPDFYVYGTAKDAGGVDRLLAGLRRFWIPT